MPSFSGWSRYASAWWRGGRGWRWRKAEHQLSQLRARKFAAHARGSSEFSRLGSFGTHRRLSPDKNAPHVAVCMTSEIIHGPVESAGYFRSSALRSAACKQRQLQNTQLSAIIGMQSVALDPLEAPICPVRCC